MRSRTFTHCVLGGALIAIAGLTAGCSVAMEATRPSPVPLDQFSRGESRDDVVKQLGEPVSTTTDADGASCDLYSLALTGHGNWAKAGIAFGEFILDVSTVGIAEVVSTPVEGATRNKKTPVWFCYKNGVLARVSKERLEAEDVASSEGATGLPGHGTSPAGAPQAAPASPPANGAKTPAPAPVSAAPSVKTE